MALRTAAWVGGILAVAGAAALIGYGAYAAGREFFTSDDVPLVVKAAVLAVAAGIAILLVTVIVDRLRHRADPRIERAES